MNKVEEIYLCVQCDGKGVKEFEQVIPNPSDGQRRYHTVSDKCYDCRGSGRMIKTTTITNEPYPKPTPPSGRILKESEAGDYS